MIAKESAGQTVLFWLSNCRYNEWATSRICNGNQWLAKKGVTNFFEMPFINIIPYPDAFIKRLMLSYFRKAAVAFGVKDQSPPHVTVEHLAKIQVDGTAAVTPKSPFRLIFKPTAAARAFMKNATVDTDFRTNLARYPVGQATYDVYALDERESPNNLPASKLVGQLIPTTKHSSVKLWR